MQHGKPKPFPGKQFIIWGIDMKEKIKATFERLQNMNIQSTLSNMEILVQSLYDLRAVYNEMEVKENAGTEDRGTSDSE